MGLRDAVIISSLNVSTFLNFGATFLHYICIFKNFYTIEILVPLAKKNHHVLQSDANCRKDNYC
ncbi:hypothetical protein LCGC14_0354450 [marine sediment metagenome]|uniref:Uncharacterized protein n=1 Tax=marine sediment metagenome TaxID=412755 RepID=A0A0F9T9W0_9ZZZZ